jgi:hypothetical protein
VRYRLENTDKTNASGVRNPGPIRSGPFLSVPKLKQQDLESAPDSTLINDTWL